MYIYIYIYYIIYIYIISKTISDMKRDEWRSTSQPIFEVNSQISVVYGTTTSTGNKRANEISEPLMKRFDFERR